MMNIERLKELKLAVGVVFQHWLDTAANQKGFDNTDSKKFFEHDAEHIQELLDEAIALQEYQPWIPVSERLPDDTRVVLAWDPLYENIYTMYRQEGQWFEHFRNGSPSVTHWMPLPEPPKGE